MQKEFENLSGKNLILSLYDDYTENLGRRDRQGGNAIKTVAEDIYSKDVHFAKELIQNADDNKYDTGITPELGFQFLEDRLEVFCNEKGFTEKQIIAVCSLGESTKKNRKKVQIGEKGIGFKSVFKISSKPQIHSGEYHFQFDANTKHPDNPREIHPYHLIVPHWMDGYSDQEGTKLILPYKEAALKSEMEELIPSAITGEILLFLKNLKIVKFIGLPDESQKSYLKKIREKNGLNYTDVECGDSCFSYMTIRKQLDMNDVEEPKRMEHTEAFVDLAFPLGTEQKPIFQEHQLYAFLPVEKFGLQFIINSDFILTANRGDLHECEWNSKIIGEVSSCLKDAVLKSKGDERIANLFLNFLLGTKVQNDSPISEVLPQAIKLLQNEKCVKTFSGEWSKPSECFHNDELNILKSGFISEADIKNFLGYEFISPNFKEVKVSILNDLGCRKLKLEEIKSIFQNNQFWYNRSADFLSDLFKWILGLDKKTSTILEPHLRVPSHLREDLIKPDETIVYFPENGINNLDFAENVNVLDDSFYKNSSYEDEEKKRVRLLLEKLGVKSPSLETILVDIVIPYYTSESWKIGDVVHEKKILKYLAKNSTSIQNLNINRSTTFHNLKKSLKVRTKCIRENKIIYSSINKTYFPNTIPGSFEEYLNDDFSKFFIHEDYFSSHSQSELNDLTRLLSIFGCANIPRCESDGVLKDLLSSLNWASRKWILGKINSHWQFYEPQFTDILNTSFKDNLLNCKVICSDNQEYPIKSTYLDNNETRCLGNSLPFLTDDINFNESFLQFVGVTTEVSPKTLLKRLRQLQQENSHEFKLILSIYERLKIDWEHIPEEIKCDLRNEPLVYHQKSKTSGVWVKSGNCRYDNPFRDQNINSLNLTNLIKNTSYDKIEEYFTECLQIQKGLNVNDLVAILEKIKSIKGNEVDQKTIYFLYRRINDQIGKKYEDYSAYLKSKEIYYTDEQSFIFNNNDIFANDDSDIYESFKDCEDIFFFFSDEKDLPNLSSFLKCSGIEKLSDAIQQHEPEFDNDKIHERWTKIVKGNWLDIVRVYFHEYKETYDEIVDDDETSNKFQYLSEFVVSIVENLKVLTELRESIKEIQKEWWYSIGEECKLLLDHKSDESSHSYYLSLAICNFISPKFLQPAELIDKLLSSSNPSEVLKVRKIPELPEEVVKKLMGENPDDGLQAPDEGEPVETDSLPAGNSNGNEDSSTHSGSDNPNLEDGTEGQGAKSKDDEKSESSENNTSQSEEKENEGGQGENQGMDGRTKGTEGVGDNSTHDGNTEDGTNNESTKEGGNSGVKKSKGAGGSKWGNKNRPKGAPKQPGIKKGKGAKRPSGTRNSQVGEFVSYIKTSPTNNPLSKTDNSNAQRTRSEVDKKAVDASLRDLRESFPNWEIEEMPHNNPCYDIYGTSKDGKKEIFIEVKGLKDNWGKGVQVSYKQFFFAKEKRDKYWLYIVEKAISSPKIYKIQNPFLKTKKFIFDYGWKLVAEGFDDSNALAKLKRDAAIGKEFYSSNAGENVEITKIIEHQSGLKRIEIKFVKSDGKDGMQKYTRREFERLSLHD